MTALPSARTARAITAVMRAVPHEFVRFGVVGAVGFVCNVAVVYALRAALGLYAAGAAAYVVAASVTWLFNRRWTFRDGTRRPMLAQWLLYLAANAFGFAIYYAVYAASIGFVALCAREPAVAVALGAALSLLVNFFASQRVVFR